MRTIAFVNRKGGVGKTRSAVETAYILAVGYQQRVLLVDADAQGDATYTIFGRRAGDGLASLMNGTASSYWEVAEHTDIPNLDIIPGSRELDQLDLHYMISDDRPVLCSGYLVLVCWRCHRRRCGGLCGDEWI